MAVGQSGVSEQVRKVFYELPPEQKLRVSAAASQELIRRQQKEYQWFFEPNDSHDHPGHTQKEVYDAIKANPNLRILVIGGGNRSGKTFFTINLCAQLLYGYGPLAERFGSLGMKRPVYVRHCVPDVKKGIQANLVPTYRRVLRRSHLLGGKWDTAYSKDEFNLQFKDPDSIVEFMTYGMDVEKYQGVPRHVIHHDEWPPEAIWNENKMRVIDYDGLLIISATPTPGSSETWAMELCDKIKAGEIKDALYFELNTQNNRHINQKRLRQEMEDMTEDEIEMRVMGRWIPLGGRVLPQYDERWCVVDQFEVPNKWIKIVAMDVHNQKPNYILFGAINPYDTEQHPKGIYLFAEGTCDGTAEKSNEMVRILAEGKHINHFKIEQATTGLNHNTNENTFRRFTEGEMALPWQKWKRDPWQRVHLLRELFQTDMGRLPPRPQMFVMDNLTITRRQLQNWSLKDPGPAQRHKYKEEMREVDDDMCVCAGIIATYAQSYLKDGDNTTAHIIHRVIRRSRRDPITRARIA